MSLKDIWTVLKETLDDWLKDKALRLGAALAYYAVFSLAPLLIIVIAIAGLFFGREAAQGRIVGEVQGLVGKEGAEAIQTMIEKASQPSSGIIASILGLATLLFGATGLFAELQDALNTIWEVQPNPSGGLMDIIKSRFISFTMVLGIGFLLLISLVVSAALSALSDRWGAWVPGSAYVMQGLNSVISFLVVMLLFAMIYKVLPDVKIAWNDVWIGAAVTSLLFTIGKFLIGLYLGRASIGSSYGAAGSLVVILIWVYYSAQILFFGAEFTQVYANKYGSRFVYRQPASLAPHQAHAEAEMMPRRARGNASDV